MTNTSLESRVKELEQQIRREHVRYMLTVSGAVLILSLFLIAEYYQGVAVNKALEAQIQTSQAVLQINQRVSDLYAEGSGVRKHDNAEEAMSSIGYAEH